MIQILKFAINVDVFDKINNRCFCIRFLDKLISIGIFEELHEVIENCIPLPGYLHYIVNFWKLIQQSVLTLNSFPPFLKIGCRLRYTILPLRHGFMAWEEICEVRFNGLEPKVKTHRNLFIWTWINEPFIYWTHGIVFHLGTLASHGSMNQNLSYWLIF